MEEEIKKTMSEILQLVTFNIENEEYAIDILNIQSINRMVEITKIPNSPDYVEGVINLRGQIIPIISLRKRLKLNEKEIDKNTRFIVVEIYNRVYGFIVDSVNEVLRIDRKIIETPPPMTTNIDSAYIAAIAKLEDKLIILLDLEKIFSKNEFENINNVIG